MAHTLPLPRKQFTPRRNLPTPGQTFPSLPGQVPTSQSPPIRNPTPLPSTQQSPPPGLPQTQPQPAGAGFSIGSQPLASNVDRQRTEDEARARDLANQQAEQNLKDQRDQRQQEGARGRQQQDFQRRQAAEAQAAEASLFSQKQQRFENIQTAAASRRADALAALNARTTTEAAERDRQQQAFENTQTTQAAQRAEALAASLQGSLASGGGGGGRVVLPRVNTSAADSARFGAAKEQVGQTTEGALRALDDQLAGAGFAEAPAGGAEAAIRGSVIQGGAQNLTDTTRGNLVAGTELRGRENLAQFQGDLGRQRQQQQQRLALQQLLAQARLF